MCVCVCGQRHALVGSLQGKSPVTHCIWGWLEPRADLDGCGIPLPPTGIRSQDRPSLSDSLYRLSYPNTFLMSVGVILREYSGRNVTLFAKLPLTSSLKLPNSCIFSPRRPPYALILRKVTTLYYVLCFKFWIFFMYTVIPRLTSDPANELFG